LVNQAQALSLTLDKEWALELHNPVWVDRAQREVLLQQTKRIKVEVKINNKISKLKVRLKHPKALNTVDSLVTKEVEATSIKQRVLIQVQVDNSLKTLVRVVTHHLILRVVQNRKTMDNRQLEVLIQDQLKVQVDLMMILQKKLLIRLKMLAEVLSIRAKERT